MKQLMACLLVVLSGCAGLMKSPDQAHYEKNRDETIAVFTAGMFRPICDPALKPPFVYSCPEMLSFETKRQVLALGKRAKSGDIAAVMNQLKARMSLRYTRADWAHIDTECKAYPGSCDNPQKIEFKAMDSHNSAVEASLMVAINNLDGGRLSQIQAQRAQERADRPVYCTSSRAGSDIETRCEQR